MTHPNLFDHPQLEAAYLSFVCLVIPVLGRFDHGIAPVKASPRHHGFNIGKSHGHAFPWLSHAFPIQRLARIKVALTKH